MTRGEIIFAIKEIEVKLAEVKFAYQHGNGDPKTCHVERQILMREKINLEKILFGLKKAKRDSTEDVANLDHIEYAVKFERAKE